MPHVEQSQAPVALVFDYAAAWAWAVQPQGAGCDYFRLVFEVYRALRKLGLSVDILPPDAAGLDGYKLILIPGAITLTSRMKAAIDAAEGQVILGPRTNAKTANLAIPVPLPPAIAGLDVTISRVETLRRDMPVPLQRGGSIGLWLEQIDTTEQVIEATTTGAPILVRNANRSYLAAWPDPVALSRILSRAAIAAELPVHDLPPDIRLRDTGLTRFIFNHGPEPVIFDGTTIPAAGVVWRRT